MESISKPLFKDVSVIDIGTGAARAHELISTGDVLSVHVGPRKIGKIVDGYLIDRMPPGAFLVNTAYQEVIDHEAVASAILSSHLGGFATDCLQYSTPDYLLMAGLQARGAPVIISPHNGGAIRSARVKTQIAILHKLLLLAQGERND